MKKGVVVITLTALVDIDTYRRTYVSRIGFCGEYNEAVLDEMKKHFKELYVEQIKAEWKAVRTKLDKVVCRASVKATECEMLLGGK